MNLVENIPFDTLQKGDYLPPTMCARAIGAQPGEPDYWRGLLSLRDYVVNELEARGVYVTVRTRRDGLAILTDSEAAIYNGEAVPRQAHKKMCKAHRRNLLVDVAQLSPDERVLHDRRILRNGRVIQATQAARRMALTDHKRTVPAIGPTPEKDS